ncbi:hypothetical protein [Desulfitobacterium hafniense]|uniref:hypothetical protein n=1 Tax=Desulfitobacterium hafniense TaxID=49338 RepID=UPI000361EE2A|nr:hypothetical protein [Desulfitobacterium hafniense]
MSQRSIVKKILNKWQEQQQNTLSTTKQEPWPDYEAESTFLTVKDDALKVAPQAAISPRSKQRDLRSESRRLAEIEQRERCLSSPKEITVVHRGRWSSLTKFLEMNKEIKLMIPRDLKNHVVDQCEELVNWKAPIIVPSRGNYVDTGQMGTAFDYLARAMLARQCKKTTISEAILTAEKGLMRLCGALRMADMVLEGTPPKYLLADADKLHQQQISINWLLNEQKEVVKFCAEKLKNVIIRRNLYMSGENIALKDLMADALFLCRLDETYRAGGITVTNYFLESRGRPRLYTYGQLNDEELLTNIKDLMNVFEGFLNTYQWQSVILNPEFDGSCIHVVADGDIIVDRTLVDFKTTSAFSYKWDYFAQVFAYASLGLKMGMDIDSVAIYFVRYNQFVTIKLNDPVLLPNFPERYLKVMIEIAKGGNTGVS